MPPAPIIATRAFPVELSCPVLIVPPDSRHQIHSVAHARGTRPAKDPHGQAFAISREQCASVCDILRDQALHGRFMAIFGWKTDCAAIVTPPQLGHNFTPRAEALA